MLTKDRIIKITRQINQYLNLEDFEFEDITLLEDELIEIRSVAAWLNNEWGSDVAIKIDNSGDVPRQYIELYNGTDYSFGFVKLYLEMHCPDGSNCELIAESKKWPGHSNGKLYLNEEIPTGATLVANGELMEYEIT